MKHSIKILSIILVSILVLQIISYQFIGKHIIPYKIIANRKTAVNEIIPRIIFEFQPKLWKWQQSKVKYLLEKNYNESIYFEEAINIDRRTTRTCMYVVSINYSFKFIATVKEGNGYFAPGHDDVYAESWESQYRWLFYKWVKLSHTCTGQS